MKLIIAEYDSTWPKLFNDEKVLLGKIGNIVKKIEHIGSTSVPGLMAKPIIDILLEVNSLLELDRQNTVFEQLGYEVMGEFGIPGRRYYRKGGENRTHQIHAFQSHDQNIERHISFREYLRAHEGIALEYARLKLKLADRCDGDIDCYINGKRSFIEHHEAKSLAWIKN